MSWERLGAELAGADPGRHDELLAALVRIARRDPDATAVVVGALAPGIRRRIARYAPGLARDDAWSIAVEGLCNAVATGPRTRTTASNDRGTDRRPMISSIWSLSCSNTPQSYTCSHRETCE
jgi:hypothetical protein